MIACYDPRHEYGEHTHPRSTHRFWLEPTKFILIQLNQKDVSTVRKVLHALPGIGDEADIVICKHISMAPGIGPTEEWDTAFKLMQKYNDAFHGMRDQIG